MKKLVLYLFIFSFGLTSFAQEEEGQMSRKELKQIAKEEKKAKRAAEDEQLKEVTDLMLHMHRFVLEADYVGDGKGQRIPVSSNINFIGIDSTEAVIQLGTVHGSGYNGVGGITVDGRVTKYDLQIIEGKRGKSYSLMVNIMTNVGIYDITFLISELGYTDATIKSLRAGQLQYSGKLVPIGLSRVYKGSSI